MNALMTDRLVIRNFQESDGPALRTLLLDKMASPMYIYDYGFPTREAEVNQLAALFAQTDRFLAVTLREGGELIGYIALNGEDADSRDLGYLLHTACHGKGYGTEACSAAIRYAFEQLGVAMVTAGTALANRPSVRLLGKLGFIKGAEATTSFHKDGDGKPIEFTGASFLLKRKAWEAELN